MASEEEGGVGADMDMDMGGSLFEGMVLFTPSDLSSSPPHLDSSSPLDDNLFSDLTLQPPGSLPSIPSTPSPTPSLHPTPSRKKKRATVRVGYARDAPDEPPPPVASSVDGVQPIVTSTERELPPPLDVPALSHPPPPPDPDTQSKAAPSSEPIPVRSGGEPENGTPEEDDDRPLETEQVPLTVAKEDSFGSIEEKLMLVRAHISRKLDRLREAAAAVSAERKALGRRRRKAAESVSLALARYRELEIELEEACEAEDFERAERVSESLAAAEKDKDAFLASLKEAEVDCDTVDAKMQGILEQQIEAEEEGVALLEQFAKV